MVHRNQYLTSLKHTQQPSQAVHESFLQRFTVILPLFGLSHSESDLARLGPCQSVPHTFDTFECLLAKWFLGQYVL